MGTKVGADGYMNGHMSTRVGLLPTYEYINGI